MKRRLLFLAALLLLTSCAAQKAEYRKIDAAQAMEMMTQGEPYLLLDTRTEAEFLAQRIEGAVLIPEYEIAGRADTELPDKHRLILVYCRSGRRSEIAARALVELGYTNVFDFGGIIDWPYDTVSGE